MRGPYHMRTPCHLTSASHVRRASSFDKSLSHENPPYQLINLSRDKLPIIRDPLSHDNQAYHVISRPPPQGRCLKHSTGLPNGRVPSAGWSPNSNTPPCSPSVRNVPYGQGHIRVKWKCGPKETPQEKKAREAKEKAKRAEEQKKREEEEGRG